jgi:hypothetical protein
MTPIECLRFASVFDILAARPVACGGKMGKTGEGAWVLDIAEAWVF